MVFFKLVVIFFLVLIQVDPVEAQVTMRPFIGECTPFSDNCDQCVSNTGCYYYPMEKNKTHGDFCWPWFMNVPMRQYATNQFRTIEECQDFFGTTPLPEIATTPEEEENEVPIPKSGEIPLIIGALLAGIVILLLLFFLCWRRYRNQRQTYGVKCTIELN